MNDFESWWDWTGQFTSGTRRELAEQAWRESIDRDALVAILDRLIAENVDTPGEVIRDGVEGIIRVERNRATAPLLAMLTRLEWDRLAKGPGIGRDYERCCGVCNGFQSDGHAPDCELSRLLAAAKETR